LRKPFLKSENKRLGDRKYFSARTAKARIKWWVIITVPWYLCNIQPSLYYKVCSFIQYFIVRTYLLSMIEENRLVLNAWFSLDSPNFYEVYLVVHTAVRSYVSGIEPFW
jgi:hypothetical protein